VSRLDGDAIDMIEMARAKGSGCSMQARAISPLDIDTSKLYA
jgi:hypothetical protein